MRRGADHRPHFSLEKFTFLCSVCMVCAVIEMLSVEHWRQTPKHLAGETTMAHRYALAAVLLTALSIPAAAQQTTPSDTSKKSSTGTTTSTSNGAIADTA